MPADRSVVSTAAGDVVAPAVAGGTIRVLVVDDQPVFRRVARELLAATDGFTEIGEAASGREALQVAADLDPDLVLLDVRMPGMDGVETARRLAVSCPRSVVVLMSLEPLADLTSTATAVGAAGHVRKQDLSPQALHDLWAQRHDGAHEG